MAFPSELWNRATRHRLVASLVISLLVHCAIYGTWKLIPASFLAARGVLSGLIAALTQHSRTQENLRQEINQAKNEKRFQDMLRQQEIPLTFVEVDPAVAVAEAPKDAKYYSTHNTVAAQPKPDKATPQPKIDGKDTRVARLFNNPKPQPKSTPLPLQPSAPPRPPEPPAQTAQAQPKQPPQVRPDAKPDAKSEPAKPLNQIADKTFDKTPEKPDLKPPGGETVGDLAMATPKNTELPNKVPGSGAPASANPLIAEPSPPPQHERPRTLAQAAQQNPALAGQLMQQDGGVARPGRISVDAQGSLFGVYDRAFIAAVEQRWYDLIDSYRDKGGVVRQGRVVLDFQIRFDGRITDMGVADKSVDELLSVMCQRAVLDPAPYARWPADMRRMIGSDSREVRFTFYYD